MNRLFTIIATAVLMSVPGVGYSQTWEQVTSDRQTYLYGEGYGNTVSDADKNALSDLISKITVQIDSKTFQIDEESTTGGKIDSKSMFNSTVRTYSQATLNNTEKIIIENEPNAHVGRWIKRAEISKIFESRKNKVRELVTTALKAEQKGKIDDALRNLYWAMSLLKSVQMPNAVKYTDPDGNERLLMTWIPAKMDEILDEMHASVIAQTEDEVELYITYKDKPVSSIDYTYFDGRDWSNIYNAKDGRGILELAPGNTSKNHQIKYEYEYRGEARMDPEIESVLNVVRGTSMKQAYAKVECKIDRKAQATSNKLAKSHGAESSFSTNTQNVVAPKEINDRKGYAEAMEKVLKAIRTKNYESVISEFTPEGLDIYKRLIHYGNARILGTPNMIYYELDKGVVARGLQMSFSFKTGIRKAFTEDVVFTFNKEKKIENISFGLGKTAETDILYKGAWPEQTRKMVMNFLENYKTAYALKRLDYIENVFDDDAVIIVANVTKKMTVGRNGDAGTLLKNNKIIKKNRYTKDQYLKNLSRCFQSNEFINIRFADNDVRRLGANDSYAIQISQDYFSSSYNDKGYLFLIVNFNDPNQPLILLRTWQEDKDPNFGLYGPQDFELSM